MTQGADEYLGIGELARKTGLSRRTIRYYISRGLLKGPLKRGRNAVYGPEHLERLEEIQELKQQGHTLAEIGRLLEGDASDTGLPEPTSWWRYQVADDVIVLVKSDSSPWRMRHIKRAISKIKNQVTQSEREVDNEGSD